MQEFVVGKDQDDSRADKILKEFCPNVSYVFLQKIFRTRRVKVNGKRIKASDHLYIGNKLQVFADVSENFSEKNASETMSDDLRNRLFSQLKKMIIFENDDFFAINKPAGLAVQPGTKISFCVETLIKSRTEKCYLVHRLDKETSGTLLIAKNLATAKKLSLLFHDNKIHKTYFAVVDGKILKNGTINSPIDYSYDAITKYARLKQIGKYTLLRLQPLTGRKHQLRIHCARDLNAPILGDTKYNKNVLHKKMFLHAYKIEIPNMNFKICAPLPDYFLEMGISETDL